MIVSKYVWRCVAQVFVISLCVINFDVVDSECGNKDWECDNGQCIPDDRLCDGKVDCSDLSDEIAQNCIQFQALCPSINFNCAYGACINGSAKCNGVQDCADNSDELACLTKTDTDFQGTCSEAEMQCLTSKECIDSTLLCDGAANCRDGSDESLEVCINFGCTSYGFQCGNGACVAGESKCNGIDDCIDGSDEAWELCNTTRKRNKLNDVPTATVPKLDKRIKRNSVSPQLMPEATQLLDPKTRCLIPNISTLHNITFKLHPRNETIELGEFVEDYEVVHIECKNHFTLRGVSKLICRNGEWNDDFPSCDGFCDGKLLSGLSLRAVCGFSENIYKCPEQISPGSSIILKCAFGYTRKPNHPQNIKCLADGSFDKKPEPCDMNCGRVASLLQTLSKNGIQIDISSAPWHVSIYNDNLVAYEYICGGSIISPTVVISAAHCFWDEANQLLTNAINYKIIAGRNTKNYSNEQEQYSQLSKVREIHIPIEYKGKTGQQRDDIAFLKLETPLKFSETIAPICVSKDLQYSASKYVMSNKAGFIDALGSSNSLERIKMNTLSYHDCLQKLPVDSAVADDKFCIYPDDDTASLCPGDSGTGFYTESMDMENGERTYNFWGVISHTPTTRNGCAHGGGNMIIAVTNIYSSPAEFKKRLISARQEDEKLF